MSERYEYIGAELELFAHAKRWKAYWSRRMAPYVRGDVLEIGSGLGTNTQLLAPLCAGSWTCLEPDERLCARAKAELARSPNMPKLVQLCGTLASVGRGEAFDTILYLDVLEHIEDDRAELERAGAHLRPGGHLIVLAPAHQGLFSPFDEAVGHFRRYDRAAMARISPHFLSLQRMEYLDSVGLLASLANRALLRQRLPTLGQIRTWDRLMVPLSCVVDPLLARRVGKSILAVWRR